MSGPPKEGPNSKKVVIVGAASVGKTCLLLRFKEGVFVTDAQPTIPFGFHAVEHGGVSLSIWDTAGTERFFSSSSLFMRNADAALVVFDVTDRDSFTALPKFWDMLVATAAPGCKVFLCASKVDFVEAGQRPAAVAEEEAVTLAKDRGASALFYTSAKTGRNVSEVFTAVSNALRAEAAPAAAAAKGPPVVRAGYTAPGPRGKAAATADAPATAPGGGCCPGP